PEVPVGHHQPDVLQAGEGGGAQPVPVGERGVQREHERQHREEGEAEGHRGDEQRRPAAFAAVQRRGGAAPAAGGGRAGRAGTAGARHLGLEGAHRYSPLSICSWRFAASSIFCIRGWTQATYSAAVWSPSRTGWMLVKNSVYHSAV